MSKKSKNNNLPKKGKYGYYPFNMMLAIYVDYRVYQLKTNNENRKKIKSNKDNDKYRQAYKQEVYAELENKTGVDWDTIKKYYLGTSTPSVKQYDVYIKFAEIFKCNVLYILPSEDQKELQLFWLKQASIDEESYSFLKFKTFQNLFKEGEYISSTYSKILNHLIHQNHFLSIYEKEIDGNVGELLHIKNYNANTKKMSYKEFRQYIQELEDDGKLNMGDKPIPSFNEITDNIVRALKSDLNLFIQNLFENNNGE